MECYINTNLNVKRIAGNCYRVSQYREVDVLVNIDTFKIIGKGSKKYKDEIIDTVKSYIREENKCKDYVFKIKNILYRARKFFRKKRWTIEKSNISINNSKYEFMCALKKNGRFLGFLHIDCETLKMYMIGCRKEKVILKQIKKIFTKSKIKDYSSKKILEIFRNKIGKMKNILAIINIEQDDITYDKARDLSVQTRLTIYKAIQQYTNNIKLLMTCNDNFRNKLSMKLSQVKNLKSLYEVKRTIYTYTMLRLTYYNTIFIT